MNTQFGETKYLIYRIGNDHFGTPLDQITEVIEPNNFSCLPDATRICLGIMNLRGEVISVYDLRMAFGKKVEDDIDNFLILINDYDNKFSFYVDQMIEVRGISDKHIEKDVKLDLKVPRDCLQGITKKDKRIIYLLDLIKYTNYI